MGLGSSDLVIKVDTKKIPGRLLKGVKSFDTRGMTADKALPQLRKALDEVKQEIDGLSPFSQQLGANIQQLSSKKTALNQLINTAKAAQAKHTRDIAAMNALSHPDHNVGVSSAILQRLRAS